MNLSHYIRDRLTQKKLLLMTHVIVGYPSLEDNWAMLEAMQAAGVDIVELQMPFSEPMADGPLFVKANEQALRNGVQWKDYFELMRKASQQFDFPLLMMGYYNSVFMMGHEKFCQEVQQNGGRGYIIADLPIEEFGDLFEHSKTHDLDAILLCTPTNSEERLEAICEQGHGFLYCVARKGVTGTRTELNQAVEQFIHRCRQHSDLPLALGFGLAQASDLQDLHGKVEIGIIGTALLRTWDEQGADAYRAHLQDLARGCSAL